MEIKIDTHGHTLASGHAYSTIQEMARAGKRAGLQMMALTEHAPEMPGTCGDFYFYNLSVIPREYQGIEILFGAELNILDEKGGVDLPEELYQHLDIVIASIHPFITNFETKSMTEVTRAYVEAMKKPFINIIGHPDDSRALPDYEILVRTAKETGTLLEANNSSLQPGSFRQGARENLLTMLDLCKQYEVAITTGSDAHIDIDVGNFSSVIELFNYCDFPEELVVTTDIEKIRPYLNKARL